MQCVESHPLRQPLSLPVGKEPRFCRRAAPRESRIVEFCVKRLFLCVILASVALPARQAEPARELTLQNLSWAFPMPDKTAPPGEDSDKPLQHVPGSTATYTEQQINPYNPPDWFPDEHPPMPEVVRHGRGGVVQACSYCHTAAGFGHPQSANLTGLSVDYLMSQIADFKSGARVAPPMDSIAKALTDEDAQLASQWFASLKTGPWVKVVEADTVPRTFILVTRLRLPFSDGSTEPIGSRIIEVPREPTFARSYDTHSGFVAYVPKGSVAKGEALVTKGGNAKTTPCVACHGETLKGVGAAPRIAGRSPLYIVRQLYNIQSGARGGTGVELMKPVVANLTYDDMLSIAAYVASRTP
jgi:cytochrome c553